MHPTLSGWSNFNDDEWELYHTDVDRSELHNLAGENPDKLRELSTSGSPRPARIRRSRSTTAARSRSSSRRGRSSRHLAPLPLLPRHFRGAGVSSGQRPQPLLRDRGVGRHPGARSRRRALRARIAIRRARALRQGQPASLPLQLRGHVRTEVVANADVPSGETDPFRRFDKTARILPASRRALSLYHGDIKVGEGRIRTQPGKFMLAGEGLCIGRDSGAGVTDNYPGTAPWRFTGGTIRRVAVDVSGEPYVDLEREAVAMMMRKEVMADRRREGQRRHPG